ncbi:hypothetical protein V6C21_09850 [[Clostridium] cellulosi]
MADNKEKEFSAGNVVRFADKEVHGLLNAGDVEFIYISVTAHQLILAMLIKKKDE